MIRNLDKIVDALAKADVPDLYLARLKPRLESWRSELDDKRRCLWPRCKQRPIGSHVISQTFLECIADSGKMLKTPKNPEIFTLHPTASRINLEAPSKASRFPGFCQTHDRVEFEGFENARHLRDVDDYRRQLIRTTTVEWQNRGDSIDLLTFLKGRRSGVAEFFATAGFDAFLATSRMQYAQLDELLRLLRTDLSSPTEPGSVAIHTDSYEAMNGIALSYADFLEGYDADNGLPAPFALAIAVIPQPGDVEAGTGSPTTRLIIGSTNARALDLYVKLHLSSPGQANDSVRKWLAEGCFSWWMNADKWDALSRVEKHAIETSLTRF